MTWMSTTSHSEIFWAVGGCLSGCGQRPGICSFIRFRDPSCPLNLASLGVALWARRDPERETVRQTDRQRERSERPCNGDGSGDGENRRRRLPSGSHAVV